MMPAMKSLSFGLRPKPPFRLDFTAWALRRRERNIVDLWDAATYQRVLQIRDLKMALGVPSEATDAAAKNTAFAAKGASISAPSRSPPRSTATHAFFSFKALLAFS